MRVVRKVPLPKIRPFSNVLLPTMIPAELCRKPIEEKKIVAVVHGVKQSFTGKCIFHRGGKVRNLDASPASSL